MGTPRKAIAVVGDTLLDKWVAGRPVSTADDCPSVNVHNKILTPGGAANVARQLSNWRVVPTLLGPMSLELARALRVEAHAINLEYVFDCPEVPRKTRYHDGQGKLFFRVDREPVGYGLPIGDMALDRRLALKALRSMPLDAILLVDYQKGFLTDDFIRDVIVIARERQVPVLADPKRAPQVFAGCVLKINASYLERYATDLEDTNWQGVATFAGQPPLVKNGRRGQVSPPLRPVAVKNHVGAGDCFLAHLALGAVNGLDLTDAAALAHAAGLVYVQQLYSRPPWPHEVRRELLGTAGKILDERDDAALHLSLSGKLVVANGVFRLPHAGHAWLCDWAKRQGDVLVVAVNDDASAAKHKAGKAVLPWRERAFALASLEAVDWVIPFSEDTPENLLRVLRPDVLVKGDEYRHQEVPGAALVGAVCFAPPDAFPQHATTIVAGWRDEKTCGEIDGVEAGHNGQQHDSMDRGSVSDRAGGG